MRRLLVIAYTFPPLAGVGIERTLKHVTYLPASGWEPIVVAPGSSTYRLIDPGTLERVPAGTDVRRAHGLEPGHLRALARRLLSRGSARGSMGAGQWASGATPGGMKRLLDEAWRRYVQLAWFPDEQIGWAPDAIRVALAAHEDRTVDAIYSSGPPMTAHLVAAAVQRATGLPWVADFRDPWVGNAYAPALPPPHRAARAELERLVVGAARRSVFASVGVRDQYAARYPRLAARFVTIYNGYDLADIEAGGVGVAAAEPDPRFRLMFTGSVQGTAEFELFADGMERLLTEDPELRDRFVVQFVGWFSPQVEAIARRRLPALGATVERLGYRPKAETLALLRGADAALVLLAPGPGKEHVPSAKLFDYLGADARILAVAPEGEVRRILRELDWGVGVDPTPDGFAEGVRALLETPAPDRPADPERRYERRSLSAELAAVLDEMMPAAGSGSRDRRPTPR